VLTLPNHVVYNQNAKNTSYRAKNNMVRVKSKAQKTKNYYSNCLNIVPPPIQLKRATWSKNADDGAVTSFKLLFTPSDPDSLQYKLKVCSFETGTVKQ
jgi:hypothetical protein